MQLFSKACGLQCMWPQLLAGIICRRHQCLEGLDADWQLSAAYVMCSCSQTRCQQVMSVNVRGVFLCLKHQIPLMLETAGGHGAIVVMSSSAGGQHCRLSNQLGHMCRQSVATHDADSACQWRHPACWCFC
jgi:hypothetical protein